jgi:hypothetical protein
VSRDRGRLNGTFLFPTTRLWKFIPADRPKQRFSVRRAHRGGRRPRFNRPCHTGMKLPAGPEDSTPPHVAAIRPVPCRPAAIFDSHFKGGCDPRGDDIRSGAFGRTVARRHRGPHIRPGPARGAGARARQGEEAWGVRGPGADRTAGGQGVLQRDGAVRAGAARRGRRPAVPGDGVVTGYGTIDSRRVCVFAGSATRSASRC